MQARFDEAVRLAETAFTDELANLVEHLTDRLSGQQDGKPKVFRDTAITNLTEFFQRFQRLNIRSNEQLDELVSQAQDIVRGVQPQQLRENVDLRERVAGQLGGVQQALDDLLVDRPAAEHHPQAAVTVMQIVITPDGTVKCLYGEELDLHALGQLCIQRGSHVEPTEDGQWTADLSPVNGPMLGPFANRSAALDAEREWLERKLAGPQVRASPQPSHPTPRRTRCFGSSERSLNACKSLLIADAALGLEAEFLARQADRKAELLQKAQEYAEQGLDDVADELRGQALGLSIETPVSSVLPGIAELNGEPTESEPSKLEAATKSAMAIPSPNGAKTKKAKKKVKTKAR